MSRERILKLTRKDFKLDWFSGSGAGGQHRNKHMNCLRLTHIASGITVTAQNGRDRPTNQREAMEKIAPLVVEFYFPHHPKDRIKAIEEVRVYREPDNRVKDHASGLELTYKHVVADGDLSEMIEARKLAKEDVNGQDSG